MMLSTYASETPATVNKARGEEPCFYQLYHSMFDGGMGNFEISKRLAQQAERDGCKVMAITVDNPSLRKETQQLRAEREDTRLCGTCHDVDDAGKPKIQRAGAPQYKIIPPDIMKQKPKDPTTWELIKRLSDATKMDIIVKGIMNPDDAALCVQYGYGVHISNHGGRNEDTGAATISALPDIAAVAKGKVPIFIDGGFRRGMDIVKALALGADMVGFGRPWMWGLGAFGEGGVERVLEIMEAEVFAAMQQVGAASVKELTPDLIYKSP